MIVIVKRMIATEGSMSAALDKVLNAGVPVGFLGRGTAAIGRAGRVAGSAAFLAGRGTVKPTPVRPAAGTGLRRADPLPRLV